MNDIANGNGISKHDKLMFWGCFIALITTAFAFVSRLFLLGEWGEEFGLDPAQVGELAGIGIWPFALSIIVFSLFIDKIGYKFAMVFSFAGYLIWSVVGVAAYFVSDGGDGDTDLAYSMLYWGSFLLGLSNGTVEAYINPVVATMFQKEKTKWLNILHAGWPGGLVIVGLVTIGLTAMEVEWFIKIGIIAVPAIVFFLMLVPLKFPANERVAAGVSYREMIGEFGVLTALVVAFLMTLQLIQFFPTVSPYVFIGIGVASVAAVGLYTMNLGNPLLFFLALIMMPLATTEIGTDSWIEEIMKGVAAGKFDPGLVLVYTSAIMCALRFCAGPIVHALSPIGLLIGSSILAIAGLWWLSFSTGVMIFAAATLYAFGKTFFWPTMLGIAGEQTPKGGALTLNALGGIGMLAVGTLGTVYIGVLQSDKQIEAIVANEELAEEVPGLVVDDKLTATQEKVTYGIIKYEAVDNAQLDTLLEPLGEEKAAEVSAEIKEVKENSAQGALANMAIFPAIMLAAYVGMFFYFKAKGGY
ncbi:MAG: MFS transporter, partial [Phycisphaeraceae bacterium]